MKITGSTPVGATFTKFKMSIESINNYTGEGFKRLRTVLYMTTLSSVLASCTLPSTLAEVSYDVTTRVGLVTDVANPNHPSSKLLFPNVPDFRTGQLLKEIEIPSSGYFEVNCHATHVIGPHRTPLGITGGREEGDVMYLYPQTELEGGRQGYIIDDSKAIKVSRRQYHDKIKRIKIEIEGIDVKNEVDPNGMDSSTGLLGTSEIVKAYKFKPGKNQVRCELTTIEGITYTDTAVVNIIDNRS